MSQVYTVEQLKQLLDKMVEIGVVSMWKGEIRQFINLVELRELKLLPPRDSKGHFMKVVTNEDLLEAIKRSNLKEEGEK